MTASNNSLQAAKEPMRSSSDAPRYWWALIRIGIVLVIVTLAVGGYVWRRQHQPNQPTGPFEKVTIATSLLPHSGLVHIAFANGYFNDERLEAINQPHSHGKVALDAVIERRADLATVAETPFMFAVMKGARISMIATIFKSVKDHAVIARKDKGILTPNDLKGKRVGVTLGTTGEFFLDAFSLFHGISRNDLKVVHLWPDEMVEAVGKGGVDAVSTWHPNFVLLQKALADKGITFYGEDLYTGTHNIAGSQDFIARNPDTIRKVLRAVLRAARFVRERPDASRTIIADAIKTSISVLSESWEIYDFGVSLDQDLLINLENQMRWATKRKLIENPTVPNFFTFFYLDGLAAVKPDAVTIIR